MTTLTQLTDEQVDTMKDLLMDIGDAHLRPYSGRSMYGQECLGIDMENMADAFRFALMVTDSDLADALFNPRFDNMGMGIIVYFPNVGVPEGVSDDDDDSDDDE